MTSYIVHTKQANYWWSRISLYFHTTEINLRIHREHLLISWRMLNWGALVWYGDRNLVVVLHTGGCTMWGVLSAPSYISKCSLGVRGRAAEERGRIDRLTKVPTCPSTQMSNHRGPWPAETITSGSVPRTISILLEQLARQVVDETFYQIREIYLLEEHFSLYHWLWNNLKSKNN